MSFAPKEERERDKEREREREREMMMIFNTSEDICMSIGVMAFISLVYYSVSMCRFRIQIHPLFRSFVAQSLQDS